MIQRLAAAIGVCLLWTAPGLQGQNAGAIEGRVRLDGAAPANPVIRMGADPACSVMYSGKRPYQEIVLRGPDGGLANVLVDLQGKLPARKAAADPVLLDQRGCMYVPRLVAAQVGQTLQVRNGDSVLHNVHSLSTHGNDFNVSQPAGGPPYRVVLKNADAILRVKCDIHSWMIAYVAVEPHPFFAVTSTAGAFRIAGVPPGRYTIRSWHERYGALTQNVEVRAGKTTDVGFVYTGKEKPSAARLVDLALSDERSE